MPSSSNVNSNVIISKRGAFFKNNLIYLCSRIKQQVLIIYMVFLLPSIYFVFAFDKLTLHKSINEFNTPFLDIFFKYATYLGDGIIFGLLIIIFLFVQKRMAYIFMVSGLLTLVVTHFFKKIIFEGVPRPVAVIGEEHLHLVEGVKIALTNSFPSGHTTTAFTVFTILCLYVVKPSYQYLCLSLAILAGFSRVYLSQHFLVDVVVGSLLGIAIGFLSMSFFKRI